MRAHALEALRLNWMANLGINRCSEAIAASVGSSALLFHELWITVLKLSAEEGSRAQKSVGMLPTFGARPACLSLQRKAGSKPSIGVEASTGTSNSSISNGSG